jgi:hypothetical protein
MTTSATAVQPEYVTLPLDRIRESTTNPRVRFNDLEELAASIRAHGLLQPILVRPVRKDFELVVGARRLRAARLAGLSSVPAQVKPLDDRSATRPSLRVLRHARSRRSRPRLESRKRTSISGCLSRDWRLTSARSWQTMRFLSRCAQAGSARRRGTTESAGAMFPTARRRREVLSRVARTDRAASGVARRARPSRSTERTGQSTSA